MKLNPDQGTFLIHFMLKNLNEIKRTDDYLLLILIFGNPHRLLWECILFR